MPELSLKCRPLRAKKSLIIMLYSEKVKDFAEKYPSQTVTVDGAVFRYILSGNDAGRTLVFLNGGMNTLEMWMDYVDDLSQNDQVDRL